MLIDVAMSKIKELISFFKKYRESGFKKALDDATEVAIELNIDPVFLRRRIIRRKRQFDEDLNTPSVEQSEEESFRVHYFLCLVDQVVVSLNKRFEQFKQYEAIFDFLLTFDKFKSLDNATLESCCSNFEQALKHNENSYIDGRELYMELRSLRDILPEEEMRPIELLRFLKGASCFSNTIVAYRILLTIPVTIASA